MAFYNANAFVFGEPAFPIAASTTISVGNMVALSTGYCATATAATGLKIVGLAIKGDGNARGNLNSSGDIDNSAGANGAFNVIVESSFPKSGGRRWFWMQNDAVNACSAATVGNPVYATGGTTVGTSSSGTSKAGTCYAFDSVNNLVAVVFDA